MAKEATRRTDAKKPATPPNACASRRGASTIETRLTMEKRMEDERLHALEKRVADGEEREKALVARTVVQSQAIEMLLGLLFVEKGFAAQEAIKQALRNATPGAGEVLSDHAAVWWSDMAVHLRPNLDAMLVRADRAARGLRGEPQDLSSK